MLKVRFREPHGTGSLVRVQWLDDYRLGRYNPAPNRSRARRLRLHRTGAPRGAGGAALNKGRKLWTRQTAGASGTSELAVVYRQPVSERESTRALRSQMPLGLITGRGRRAASAEAARWSASRTNAV